MLKKPSFTLKAATMTPSHTTRSHKGYQGSIEVSLEDNCLYGRILHIDGIISYDAESVEGVQAAFEEAVDEYLADCEAAAISPVKPFGGVFQVRITPEKHRQAAHCAAAKGQKLNEFVANAIDASVQTSEFMGQFTAPTTGQTGEWNIMGTRVQVSSGPAEQMDADAVIKGYIK